MYFLKIEFFGKIDVVAWFLMTTLKDKSIHSQYSILLVCFFWNKSLMNDSSCHNGDKDGDQKNDFPYDQLNYNIAIRKYVVAMEQEKVKMNHPNGTQQYEIGWAWNSREYERKHPFHIQD